MKQRLALLFASVLVFAGLAAGAPAKTPVFGTEDSCAALFVESAQACGSNPTPYIVHCSYNSSTGHYFVGWSDGRWYYNPNGCW